MANLFRPHSANTFKITLYLVMWLTRATLLRKCSLSFVDHLPSWHCQARHLHLRSSYFLLLFLLLLIILLLLLFSRLKHTDFTSPFPSGLMPKRKRRHPIRLQDRRHSFFTPQPRFAKFFLVSIFKWWNTFRESFSPYLLVLILVYFQFHVSWQLNYFIRSNLSIFN